MVMFEVETYKGGTQINKANTPKSDLFWLGSMNGKKPQKSSFSFHRSKVEVKKEKDSNEPASLFLQCPICFCNVEYSNEVVLTSRF